jgi:hypothetical protein
MTGKKLLKYVLRSWNYEDFRPHNWGNPQNSASKKWSKLVRQQLKREFIKELSND